MSPHLWLASDKKNAIIRMANTAAKEVSTGTRIMKWVYWIVGLAFVCAVCYVLFNTLDRQIASVLVFLGGILVLYFYYVKWFIASAQRGTWPPYQTVCPDYLTPVSPGSDGGMSGMGGQSGVVKCVDFVGVSRNGAFKKSSPSKVQESLQSDAHSFTVNPKESPDTLKSRLQTYGLTWISLFGNN